MKVKKIANIAITLLAITCLSSCIQPKNDREYNEMEIVGTYNTYGYEEEQQQIIEIIEWYVIIGVILLISLIMIWWAIAKSGNEFRSKSRQIEVGMKISELKELMGEPSYVKKIDDRTEELVYEKSEFKGWLRGGTKTRRIEIIIKDDKVYSLGKNENCEMTGW